MSGYGEFEFIAELLAPLAGGHEGAFALKDDAAVLAPSPGHELVVTADTLVAGRHFLKHDDPALVARKALRANLSDLAAMGAQPRFYMTSLVWPMGTDRAVQSRFVDGLKADQEEFGVTLIGGDTTAGEGPFTISLTAFGEVPVGEAVRRATAGPGDVLMVTGTIGDAGLGLRIAHDELELGEETSRALLERHYLPAPRVALAAALRTHARAGIDVSDGLIADAGHIAKASGLGLEIDLAELPLSEAALAWLGKQDDEGEARRVLASSGDDYELACAVAPDQAKQFAEACRALGVPARQTGRFTEGDGIRVTFKGREIEAGKGGFTHF